jgi:hypothetical protein
MVVYGESMDNSLIQELENEVGVMGVPVCGANLYSTVFDRTNFIGEVHYKIGTRLYRKCRLGIMIRNNRKRKKEIWNLKI